MKGLGCIKNALLWHLMLYNRAKIAFHGKTILNIEFNRSETIEMQIQPQKKLISSIRTDASCFIVIVSFYNTLSDFLSQKIK